MLNNRIKTEADKRITTFIRSGVLRIFHPHSENKKEKNQSLRMSERSSLIKRARASERMSMILFSKKGEKKIYFYVDVHQRSIIMLCMIIEKIRKRIEKSGKSLNQIGRDTGIDKAALSRIMNGGSCKVETADILFKYFGLTVTDKKSSRKAQAKK
jgi:hypothetical protein